MNKIVRFTSAVITVGAIALSMTMTACSHEHDWGEWQHDETEHWRVCSICKEEERASHAWSWQRSETEHWHVCTVCGGEELRGEHTGGICDECAEFKVLSFGYDEKGDPAHSDFAKEANVWFYEKGLELGFIYDYVGTEYSYLNDETLAEYDLVMFLNDRPHDEEQKAAFERYMENGGAWMGFHACAFSMDTNNEYWEWYQSEFLGCGNYAKNTWDPTSEPLKIESYDHVATENFDPETAILDLENVKQQYLDSSFWQGLELEEDTFLSAPCEWYAWESETGIDADGNSHVTVSLFDNDDITVLLSLNPTEENPAGDDHRPGMSYQIWTDGHYPIAWANKDYKMVYMNWGHNLQSYDEGEEGTSSSTFSREAQNQFMLDAMFGLTKKD